MISGGTSGIGLAAAERFLEEGARVFVAGLDPAEVAAAVAVLARKGQALGLACDVSTAADVGLLVERAEAALGGVDVLINNAGVARRDAFLEIAVTDWDRILAVNLRGMFLVAQAVSRRMAERGRGVIVNMSSTNGLAGEEDYAHYNASKGGVLQLTKTMAVELGRPGSGSTPCVPATSRRRSTTPSPRSSAPASSRLRTWPITSRSAGWGVRTRSRPPMRSSRPTTPRSSTAPRWSSTAGNSR